ncbi:tetratricopeptide repeat protein, partial [Candidatus Roizmanbacteria bacterium]|nr:tetratricopeptide repeat protein [Candidatus Roizmanbacteria bacterium]
IPLSNIISASSFIISLTAIFFFIKSTFFSPIGNQFDLLIFLGFSFLIQLAYLDKKSFFSKIIFAAILAGLAISLKPLLASDFPYLPPYRYFWKSAANIFNNPVNALFGIGVDNYSSIFTKVKDGFYNQSKFWQINSFNVSRSTLLHVLTESGLAGFLGLILLLLYSFSKSIKSNKKFILLIIYFTCLILFFPPSLPLFFIMYIILLGGASGRDHASAQRFFQPVAGREHLREGNSLQNLTKSRREIDLKEKPLFYFIPLALFIFIAITAYFLARSYLAEYYFKKSLDGLANKNIKIAYDNQRLAILTNRYIERYRIAFSQTNLLIANSTAQKASQQLNNQQLAINNKSSDVLSPQDRQTISQAIQAAIEEGKAAVSLNSEKAGNWENLGDIYSNLVNTAEGANQWAISSYQRAITLDPQNVKYRIILGGVYYLQGNYTEAGRYFEQAIALKPDWPNAHYNLAWALYQKKDYQRAISEMQTVINLLAPLKESADLEKAKKDLTEFRLKLLQ